MKNRKIGKKFGPPPEKGPMPQGFFKGALADANKGQAMSPGTGATGGTRSRGRDPSAQFDGTKTSPEAKQALATQRKTTRETLNPSTKLSSKIIQGLASSVIPGGGFLVAKMQDSVPYYKRGRNKKKTSPFAGRDNRGDPAPLPKVESIDINAPELPIGKKPIVPYKFDFQYRDGGMVRGSGKILKNKIKKARIF